MCESQALSSRGLWRSCFTSIAGAIVVWATAEYAATTEGYYDSESYFWDYVALIELASFGIFAGWSLWEGLARRKVVDLFPRDLFPVLTSAAFIGYAFLWFCMFLLLLIGG